MQTTRGYTSIAPGDPVYKEMLLEPQTGSETILKITDEQDSRCIKHMCSIAGQQVHMVEGTWVREGSLRTEACIVHMTNEGHGEHMAS